MNDYYNEELKRLISESLRERPDSYLIQQLFDQFPTTTELMDLRATVNQDKGDRRELPSTQKSPSG